MKWHEMNVNWNPNVRQQRVVESQCKVNQVVCDEPAIEVDIATPGKNLDTYNSQDQVFCGF